LACASSSATHVSRGIRFETSSDGSNLLSQDEAVSQAVVDGVEGPLLSVVKGLMSSGVLFSLITSQVLLLVKELLLSLDHALVFSLALFSQVLVNGKGNSFELLLLEELIKNLVVLHVESSLSSIAKHLHFWIELFISLEELSKELNAVESKPTVLCKPNKGNCSEKDGLGCWGRLESISHTSGKGRNDLITLGRSVSLEEHLEHWALNVFHLVIWVADAHVEDLVHFAETNQGCCNVTGKRNELVHNSA